ncbi:hypothetical protein K449DRAFT_394406 [Hypoxylon sp. EC38]|nr:hypothetical protein K449DRAFT_394406 [Hypoxylon sp. EC38]
MPQKKKATAIDEKALIAEVLDTTQAETKIAPDAPHTPRDGVIVAWNLSWNVVVDTHRTKLDLDRPIFIDQGYTFSKEEIRLHEIVKGPPAGKNYPSDLVSPKINSYVNIIPRTITILTHYIVAMDDKRNTIYPVYVIKAKLVVTYWLFIAIMPPSHSDTVCLGRLISPVGEYGLKSTVLSQRTWSQALLDHNPIDGDLSAEGLPQTALRVVRLPGILGLLVDNYGCMTDERVEDGL